MVTEMEGQQAFPIGRRWLAWGLILLALGGSVPVAKADVPPEPTPAQQEFREPDAGEPERLVTIAIYLLIAVTVAIVSLLILVILWGARVRRQARKPLPSTTPNDPLWYLKGKNSKLAEPNPAPGVSESSQPGEQEGGQASANPGNSDEPPSA